MKQAAARVVSSSATVEEEFDADGNPVPAGSAPTPEKPALPRDPHERFPVDRQELAGLETLKFEESLQSRVKISAEKIKEYTEIISERVARGEDPGFPAIDVFEDPVSGDLLVAGGFHRGYAHEHAGLQMILVNIRIGNHQDARLFAASENTTHGLSRTQADKQNALKIVLEHPDSPSWSNVDIAKIAGVSEFMVRDHRAITQQAPVKIIQRAGKAVKLDTSRIGMKGGTQREKAKEAKPGKAEKLRKGDGSAPATDAKGRPTLSLDEHGEQALKKIIKAIGPLGAGFEESVRTGAIPLTRKDITDLAGLEPSKIRRILPLVEDGEKPSLAIKYLDYEVNTGTKVEDLQNLALAGKPLDLTWLCDGRRIGLHQKMGGYEVIVLAPERKR